MTNVKGVIVRIMFKNYSRTVHTHVHMCSHVHEVRKKLSYFEKFSLIWQKAVSMDNTGDHYMLLNHENVFKKGMIK